MTRKEGMEVETWEEASDAWLHSFKGPLSSTYWNLGKDVTHWSNQVSADCADRSGSAIPPPVLTRKLGLITLVFCTELIFCSMSGSCKGKVGISLRT
jgi:hypothetical protein